MTRSAAGSKRPSAGGRSASPMAAWAMVIRLAFRNLGRNRRRTLLALASIAVAQFFVLVVDGFLAGYGDVMRDIMTGPLLGHVQVHAPQFTEQRSMDQTLARAKQKVQRLGDLPEVESVFPRVFAPSLAARSETGFVAVVIGVDAEAESAAGGFLEAGVTRAQSGSLQLSASPLDAPDGLRSQRALVGSALARRQHLKVGDELAVVGQTVEGAMAADLVTISGIIVSNLELIDAQGIVIDLGLAQEIYGLDDQVHELTLRGSSAAEAVSLARKVRGLPEFEQAEVQPWQEGAPELLQMTTMMDTFTWLILGFVFVAAAAGIANTMVMSAFERTREMGVLMALGATPARLIGMLVVETLLLGTIGLCVGTALGASVTAWLGETGLKMTEFMGSSEDLADLTFQGISFNMTVYSRLRGLVIGQSALAMALTCAVSVLWPIRMVLRLHPTEAMRR